MTEKKIESLIVKVYETRDEMGREAAKQVAEKIRVLLTQQDHINMVFAAAPSQNEFLHYLTKEQSIEWRRVNAFHMDEYIGLPKDAPQNFSHFLKEKIFDQVPFRNVYLLNGQAADPRMECRRYAELLERHPTDIVCMGIGENTHIAFNDPHAADFHDNALVKIVGLEAMSRQQQVNDGCFESLEMVPTSALTLTVPALLRSAVKYCVVPGKNKSEAVRLSLTKEISEKYPASILRTQKNCFLFLDQDSAESLIKKK